MAVVESTDDLKQLPLFALLAYAGRCARRVFPLFRLDAGNPEAPLCRQAVETAIRLTEALASGADVDPVDLCVAEEGSIRAVVVASEMLPPDERAAYAANAAYAAISAAKALLESFASEEAEGDGDRVADAAQIARDAAISADERVAHAAHLDWDMLRRMFLGKFPDFGEPVDATETGMLGPLFHDGAEPSAKSPSVPSGDAGRPEKRRSGRGAKSKPRKEDEQQNAGHEYAQLAELADKIEREAKKIREQQQQLRADAEQLAVGRTNMLAEMDSLRAQVETERQQVESERQQVESERQSLRKQLEEFETRQLALAKLTEQSAEGTNALQAAQQQLDARRVELDRDREKHRIEVERFETQSAAFAAETKALNELRRQIEADRELVFEDSARLQAALQKAERDGKSCEESRARHETAQQIAEQELAARRVELAVQAEKSEEALRQHQADRQRLVDETASLQAAMKQFEIDRQQLETEKERLRAASESQENERREFLEEKMRWKPDVSGPAAAAPQQASAGSQKPEMKRRKPDPESEQPPAQPPAAPATADLGEQLFRLQAERQQLQATRAQFAQELQRMRAGRINPASASADLPAGGTSKAPQSRPKVLRLLLDPGRAASRAIAELLSEIVMLGRLSGIHIARLETSDCRTCRLGLSPKSASDVDRAVLELHLWADQEGKPGLGASDSMLWDQFESSLRMIISVEGGLTQMFSLGGPAPEDHKFRAIGRDVIDLATQDATRRATQNPVSQPGTLPVDLITRQLQKVEDLLRRMSSEWSVTLELAPPGERNLNGGMRRAGGGRLRPGKRFWIGCLVSATLLGLAAGIYWWTAIAKLMGIAAG